MSELTIPDNPATIGQPLAEKLVMGGALDVMEHTSAEVEALGELTRIVHAASMLGGRYFVESAKSVLTPATEQMLHDVTVTHFNTKLHFTAEFTGYSTVRIGRLIGGNAIRALCLQFKNVTLWPYGDTLPDDKWFFTPVHAVTDMEQRTA